jgi:hypothetical protein
MISGLFQNCNFYRHAFISWTECGCTLDSSRSLPASREHTRLMYLQFYKTQGISGLGEKLFLSKEKSILFVVISFSVLNEK